MDGDINMAFDKKGYYVILGVEGEDTMYFGLKDADSFHATARAILLANVNDEFKFGNVAKLLEQHQDI